MLFRLDWFYFWKIVGVFPYFHEGCWNCNLRVISKNLLRKLLIFFIITFAHRENYFVSFSKIFWRGCQKLHFFVQKNIFLEHFFGELCFSFILGLWQKFFSLSLLTSFFSRCSLNWNLHFHRNISREKVFWDNLCFSIQYFFRHWAKSFDRSSVTFPRCYQNWKLHVHRNSLREKDLFGTVCVFPFYLFSHIEQKVLAVLRYFARGFTEAAFYVSIGIFLMKRRWSFLSFLDLQRKNSVCSSEDFSSRSHNYILSIGKVSRKVFLKNFCFFSLF